MFLLLKKNHDLRSFHDDSNTSRLDGFLDSDGDLLGESLLNLESATECFGYSCELRDTEDELVRNVANMNLDTRAKTKYK